MPKKVVLHGDALKLLYTFLERAEAEPTTLADVLYYDYSAFEARTKQLRQQIDSGKSIEWDDLDEELERIKE